MKTTKLLALTLSLLMVLSCFSFTVFAEDEAVEEPVEVADTASEEASAEEPTEEEPVAEEPSEEETPTEEPSEGETPVEEPSEEETPIEEPSEEETPAEEPAEEETPVEEPSEGETPIEEPAEEETPAEKPSEEETPVEEPTEEDTAVDLFEGEETTQTVSDPIFAKLSLTTKPYVGLENSMDEGYSAFDTANNIPYIHFDCIEGKAPQLNNYSMTINLDTTQEYVYLAIYLRTNVAGQTGKTNDWSNNGKDVAKTSGGDSLAASVGGGNWERMIYKIKTNAAPYIKHHAMYLFGEGYKATATDYVDVAGFAYFYDQYSAENYSFAVADPGTTFTITYKNGDETLFEDLIASTQVVVPMRKVDVEGKELVAWTHENGNTNKLYSPNLDFTGITADTTLYAVLADSTVNANIPTQNVYFVKERGGSNSNDGLSATKPLSTIVKAHEKIAAAESATATIVIMGSYEQTNDGTKLGVAGKTVTYMGYNDAATMWLTKSGAHQLAGHVAFSNINIVKSSGTEPIITAMGYNLTYGENCGTYVRNKCGSYRLAQFHYNGSFPATIDSTVTLKSGSYDKVMTTMNTVSGFYSVINGKSTVVVDGATIAKIAAAHNYQASGWFKGTQSVIINSGTVGNVSFDANYGQSGVRYIQINGGDITGEVKTTDQIRGAHGNGVSATSAENYTGVSIVEVNGGNFTTKAIGVHDDMSNLTRVVIFNNGMGDGFKVYDTKATVIKSGVGGTVKAKYTEPTADNGYTSSLLGFTIDTTSENIYIDGVKTEKKDLYELELGTTHFIMFADTAIYNVTWSVLGEDTVEVISADGTLSHTVDEKIVDKKHYYDFDGWYVGEEKVDLATYTLTGNTTFTAKYAVKGDIAPSVSRDYTSLSQVDYSATDMKKNPKTFNAALKIFKGVEACEIAPYYNAADYENRTNKNIRNIGIEGYNTYPANFSTYPRHSSESRYLSADVYDHILVKYYYVPGTNTATRQFYMFIQKNDDPRGLSKINDKAVDMVGGKWTYAHFDLTGEHGKADSLQYHLRPMNNIPVNTLVDTGEKIYIDSMIFLTEAPNIVTARFVDESDNLIFEMDVLSGETFTVLDCDDIVAPAGKRFIGWTTTKGSSELATLAITENTTFYPVFEDVITEPIAIWSSADAEPYKQIEGGNSELVYSGFDTEAGLAYYHLIPKANDWPQFNKSGMNIPLDSAAHETLYATILMRTNVKEVNNTENTSGNSACFVYRGEFSNFNSFADSAWTADGTWERKVLSISIRGKSKITQISMFPLNRAKPTTENPWYDIAGIALFYDEYSARNYDFTVTNPTTVTVTWMNGETEVRKDTLLKGMSLMKVVPPTVTAEGKTFKHWYTTDMNTAVESFEGITENTVFKAAYEEDITYTVTFTDGATPSFTTTYNKTITVPAYNGTVPEGQEFVGWKNTASDEVLTVGSVYTVIGNASFEAKFETKTVSKVEPDNATIPTDVVINVEEKTEAPSADKITAIETAIGELNKINEVALSFEITAEKDSAPVTELGANVSFKLYFSAIANYSDAKTYRLFHFNADGTIKEECVLTKNADHFAFTVSTLSPFVLAEVGVDDTVVQYIPVATYNKGAKTVTVSLSVKGAKLGYGSFGFAYDSTKLKGPVLAYKSTVAQAVTDFGISETAKKVADGVVRDTWMGWDGTTVAMIDASTAAVEFATITFNVSDDFSESDFRANPTNYFYVDTPAASENINTKFYNNGCWRVDIWSDTVTNAGADPTTVADLTVTAPTTATVSGVFEKVGTSVISVAGDPAYDSKAVVTLYAKDSTTPYATATTDEVEKSGSDVKDVAFMFTDVELGEYYFTIEKNGYIKYASAVVAVTEDTDITVGVKVVLIPGDIKGSFNDKVGDGVVDIYDFIRVIRGFDTAASASLKGAVDINEDSRVDISDLGLIKINYKKSTNDYGN